MVPVDEDFTVSKHYLTYLNASSIYSHPHSYNGVGVTCQRISSYSTYFKINKTAWIAKLCQVDCFYNRFRRSDNLNLDCLIYIKKHNCSSMNSFIYRTIILSKLNIYKTIGGKITKFGQIVLCILDSNLKVIFKK